MPTIAQQLTQLESDRQDLVDNLETKGITGLTGDETFTELVPEVLNIPSGGGGGDLPSGARHIQVGDILANKKIYFNFPDDIFTSMDTYFTSKGYTIGKTVQYMYFISTDPNAVDYTTAPTSGYGSIYFQVRNANSITPYRLICFGNGSLVPAQRYSNDYYYSHRVIDLTIGAITSTYNALFNHSITYIDTNNPAYQYIWVEEE